MAELTREEVLQAIGTGEREEEDPVKVLALADARLALVEVQGRTQFYDLRSRWSNYIAVWITFLIVFNVALTVLVGIGCLNFQDYQWFISAITVETFLQIVGMGYVAVKFLFSSGK